MTSLKIEGRLKSPEYVANITRIYRHALDSFRRQENDGGAQHSENASSTQYDLEMAFSRGLYTGWFRGTNNQQLVHARFGKKRGVYLGQVTAVGSHTVNVRLEAPLKAGDGVVFDAGKPEQTEEGGRVYGIKTGRTPGQPRKDSSASPTPESGLTFGRGAVDFRNVHVGDRVWKTSDPELDRRLRQSFAGDHPQFQRPICMEVHGRVGEPLTLIARDEIGNVVEVQSGMPLANAEKQPITNERLRQQLERLGGTPFRLGQLTNALEGSLVLPVSELNRLRREAVRQLEHLRSLPKRWTLNEPGPSKAKKESDDSPAAAATPELIVLVRNLPQLESAMSCGIETIYCEFEDPKKYREAVQRFRDCGRRSAHSALFVAPPRIFKMGEEWTLKQVRSCEADGYLIRNYDHLEFFGEDRRVGDFSLNVANHLTAEYFKEKHGLERLTASYDLNFSQLEALLSHGPAEWFEITIHQHMPMFHMEHCVFCAFLSQGTDYTNCGRPCDHHDLKLRDRVGAEHPVKADVGCRNTVFNALAQTGAEYVTRMVDLGARHFRIEFVNEPPGQVTTIIEKYLQLLRREISGQDLWRELKLLNQLGVTRGQISSRQG